MALEATHIRFALSVKDRYEINNIAEYIQGAIYPDSRYVSGIGRELTHNDLVLNAKFANTDFKSGWQTHQLCDIIQRRVFHKTIPGFDSFQPNGPQPLEHWVTSTAAKIIADMKDCQSFDLQPALKYLNSEYCPNGENIHSIKEYNHLITDLYQDKDEPLIGDYIKMWNKFGIDESLSSKVRKETEKLISLGLEEAIWSCFDKMIINFKRP